MSYTTSFGENQLISLALTLDGNGSSLLSNKISIISKIWIISYNAIISMYIYNITTN